MGSVLGRVWDTEQGTPGEHLTELVISAPEAAPCSEGDLPNLGSTAQKAGRQRDGAGAGVGTRALYLLNKEDQLNDPACSDGGALHLERGVVSRTGANGLPRGRRHAPALQQVAPACFPRYQRTSVGKSEAVLPFSVTSPMALSLSR